MGKPKIPSKGVYHGHFGGPVSQHAMPKTGDGLKPTKPSGPAGDVKPVDTGDWMTPFIKKRDYQFKG